MLPRSFPSMLLYFPTVAGGDALFELDSRLRNVKIPLFRLPLLLDGEVSSRSTSK